MHGVELKPLVLLGRILYGLHLEFLTILVMLVTILSSAKAVKTPATEEVLPTIPERAHQRVKVCDRHVVSMPVAVVKV